MQWTEDRQTHLRLSKTVSDIAALLPEASLVVIEKTNGEALCGYLDRFSCEGDNANGRYRYYQATVEILDEDGERHLIDMLDITEIGPVNSPKAIRDFMLSGVLVMPERPEHNH